MSQIYSIEDMRSLHPHYHPESESQITPKYTSLAQFVCVRFPKTFAELAHDLEDAASYQITQSDPTLSSRELKKRINDAVTFTPRTHFDLFRKAHAIRNTKQNNSLREGVWEGVGNRDYVDGLLFFYVSVSAKENVETLEDLYNSNSDESLSFRKKYPAMELFFSEQKEYFTRYSGHFVAFARCLEVYYAASGLDDKNPNRYYSRFDLNHFYELAHPIKRDLFESSLNDHSISSLSTKFFGEPCFFPAEKAQHLLNMIAQHNRKDLIVNNPEFGKWLQNYKIVDESKYDNITDSNWKERQDFDFDDDAREDQDIRAYFANYFVSDLAESHKNNPDTNLVYRERRLYRNDQWTNGIADYIIQIGNTSSKYWLPVEVKIDIADPKNKNILDQVKKYIYCNSFINPHTGDLITIPQTHGVVLIIDKDGAYLTKDGEFVPGCGIGRPKWIRRDFAQSDALIDEIRKTLISEIRRSVTSSTGNTSTVPQPTVSVPVTPQPDTSRTQNNPVPSPSVTPARVNTSAVPQPKASVPVTPQKVSVPVTPQPDTSRTQNNPAPYVAETPTNQIQPTTPTQNSSFWWIVTVIVIGALWLFTEAGWNAVWIAPIIVLCIKYIRPLLKYTFYLILLGGIIYLIQYLFW
jgi:hypothetical protein